MNACMGVPVAIVAARLYLLQICWHNSHQQILFKPIIKRNFLVSILIDSELSSLATS